MQVHFESFHRSCRNSYTRNRISINYLLTAISTTEITLTRALQVYVPLRKCNENFVDFFPPGKGRRPYTFCHAKRQSEYLGGWVTYIYHDILCDKVVPKKIWVFQKEKIL